MPGQNDLGPYGGGVNASTVEPGNFGDSGSNDYTWYVDCTDANSNDGTRFTAQAQNRILKYIRRACDGMGITRDESDTDRLLKAIQKADKTLEDLGATGVSIHDGVNVGTNAYKLRKLKAGTNISITQESGGELTIAVSGGGGGAPTLATLAPMLSVQGTRAGNSSAQSIPGGSVWTKRPLNTTIVNQIAGASISGDVITLPAGTYRADFGSVANQCFTFRARLRNTTDNVTLANALGVDSGQPGVESATVPSLLTGARFTLGGTRQIELQLVNNTGGSVKGGDETNISPETHIDSFVTIIKEA